MVKHKSKNIDDLVDKLQSAERELEKTVGNIVGDTPEEPIVNNAKKEELIKLAENGEINNSVQYIIS